MSTRLSTFAHVVSLACLVLLVLPSCGGRRSEQFRQQGDTMLELGNLDEASEYYAQAFEADAQNAGAVVGQGKVLAARGEHEAAMEKFRAAMEMDSANTSAYEAAVASLLDVGNKDEAAALAKRLASIDSEKSEALLATINSADTLSADVTPSASTPMESAGTSEPTSTPQPAPTPAVSGGSSRSWDVLWREGSLAELLDNRHAFASITDPQLDQALVASAVFLGNFSLARELAEKLPADSKVRAFLDVLESNDLNQLVSFADSWTPDPANGFDSALRNNLIAFDFARRGARAKSIQLLSQTLQQYPDYRLTMANVAWIYRAAGMPEQETRVLQRWVLDAPENMGARTLLFERFRRSGQYDDARQAAEVAFSLFPDNVRANLNLSQAYLDAGENDVALTTLNNALKQNPGDVRLNVARCEVLLHSNQAQEALDILATIDASQGDEDVRYRAALVKAFANAATGNWPAVVDSQQTLVGAGSQSVLSAEFLVAAALIRGNQPQAAIGVLTVDDPAKEVANPLTALILASLGQDQQLAVGQDLVQPFRQDATLLSDFTYALALKAAGLHAASYDVLQTVEAKTPKSTLIVDLLLRALLQGLTIEDRLAKGQAIAEKYADLPVSWIGLSLLARALNDEAAELAALDKAAEVGPNDATVWMHRGQFFARRNQIPEAMEAFRKQLSITPDDPMANNNLSYYLTLSGENLEEALERAQKAKEALGPNPNVLHTLGVVQLRLDKLDESQENLAIALELRPGEPTLLLDFGQLLIEKGQEEEGKRHIEMALRYSDILGLDFPRRNEAIKILGLDQDPAA